MSGGGKIANFVVCLFLVCILVEQVDSQNQLTCNSFANWQAYYSSWFTLYPSYAYYNMYPFGTIYCDTNATSSARSIGFNPGIQFAIPFYGSTWKSVWISPYGYLIFNDSLTLTTPPMNYIQMNWPNPNFPTTGSMDPPFAAIFYAYMNYRIDQPYEPSQISYRVLDPTTTTNTALQSIMLGMLNLLSLDVQRSAVGAQHFNAQRGLVITYYNVTLYGNPCTTAQNLYDTCLRNTFQMALVTDYVNTYTVYNYFNVTWVGSNFQQNCDPATGQASAAYPNCIPAQIGFNSGFGRGWTPLPYSETSNVINMATMSGTNVTGRWIYKVSGDRIKHGGCTNSSSLGGPEGNGTWPLVISPIYGPQFGGNVVNVSGPCFMRSAAMTILCRFGQSKPVHGYYYGDMMQVMCVAPMMFEVGLIRLSVSTDNGANYYFSTTYTVVQQEYVPDFSVQVVNTINDWLNPTTIELTWNPASLATVWGNQVTVQLMGYSKQSWQVLYTFEFQSANTGSFTFTYQDRMCYNQNNGQVCAKYDLGAFRVSLSDWQWEIADPIALWSSPVPLGWFMKDQVSYYEGKWWSIKTCQKWFNSDSISTAWLSNLDPCPCTLNQSYVDFGRFQPTPDCNLLNHKNPGACPRNPGAIACYQSTNVTVYGSSNRCCYNQYGNLMYTGDGINGSVSQRASPNGLSPYVISPYVPSISDWEIDIMPWYYCCQWQSNPYDCFNLYMTVRPTQDCVTYSVSGHATAYGDPHFITMDGTLYSFNAWGEFWLLQVINAPISGGMITFSMQARFQQPFNQTWGQIKATVMTAVAMQLNNATIVSVLSNLYNPDENLLIYVNSTLLNFSFPGNYRQEFPEFTIINNDPPTMKTYSNFTIIYKFGLGVNIAWAHGVMEMFATVPPEFKYQTGGLFGYWNGNSLDDLVPRGAGSSGSSQAVNPADSRSVFYSFGLTWLVQPDETIFTYLYRSQLNYNYYRNTWFVPYFTATIPPNGTVTTAQVNAVCNMDTSCQFDYMVTQNESIAQDTYAITRWDTQLRTMGNPVAACGWLNIPNAIRAQPTAYVVGSTINVMNCMSGFEEFGTSYVYTCQPGSGYLTAQWNPSKIGVRCVYLNGKLPAWQQIAIAVPLCVIGLVLIVLLIVFCLRRRRQKKEEKHTEMKEVRRAPAVNSAAGFDIVMLQGAPGPGSRENLAYNNAHGIVTGPLPGDYIEKASRSSTPSKSSLDMGAPMSRSHDSNLGLEMGPRQVVTYTIDPGARAGINIALEPPYVYPNSGTREEPNGADYYQRRYGSPMERSASKESLV